MPALKVHHTPTSTKPWDGGQAEKNLKNDGDAAYYRQAYAWQDPDANPDTKSAYKFPHHEVSADGEIGAANVRACQSVIAILNGGMGGADIPDSDRRGVYRHVAAHLEDRHVAAHLEDAGKDVPELKASAGGIERRSWSGELRTENGEGPTRIVGYAAVFDSWYEEPDLGFRERIRPGAFAKTIQESDIRALWNHDPNYVLGRTKNGTLTLREDERGLWMEVIPPDTQWARDLMRSIERGDVDQQSFGFRVIKDEWKQVGEWRERELVEVQLYDVSPVTFPAYEETIAQVRSLLENNGIDVDQIIDEPNAEMIRQAIEVLTRHLPEPLQGGHSVPGTQARKSLAVLRKKLELAEALEL